MKRTISLLGFTLMFFLLFSLFFTAQASSTTQLPQFSTPTPGTDGRIIYIVPAGYTCLQIQLLTGVSVDQLISLNRLDANCTLTEGQQLILGFAGPAAGTATPGVAPTATQAEPTPTIAPGNASVCVLLYDDVNGDAERQDTEVDIPGGAVSITGASGLFSKTASTVAGTDPICFSDVPQDVYTISVAAPDGYNPTTAQNNIVDVKAGDQVYVGFGAQLSTTGTTTSDTRGNTGSSWLGILGLIMLLGGVGLGVYYWRFYGRPKTLKKPKYPLR